MVPILKLILVSAVVDLALTLTIVEGFDVAVSVGVIVGVGVGVMDGISSSHKSGKEVNFQTGEAESSR